MPGQSQKNNSHNYLTPVGVQAGSLPFSQKTSFRPLPELAQARMFVLPICEFRGVTEVVISRIHHRQNHIPTKTKP
jgi:hypothetical protein